MTPLESLVAAERAFADASRAMGTHAAFLAFLGDDAVLFRPLAVPGRQWMLDHPPPPEATGGLLSWYPIYADISRARDLGYTTGPWEFRRAPSDAEPLGTGHYVSAWKRQPDGVWKVWLDVGISCPPPETPHPQWEATPEEGAPSSESNDEFDVGAERNHLLEADRAFAAASAQDTVDAYRAYLADDARLYRMTHPPLTGREAREAFLSGQAAHLTWEPTETEVARSGDLGITYGVAQLYGEGAPPETQAYARFWRRLPNDGTWKVVLDITNPVPPAPPAE
ncbi:MAG TPA: nuclear transport factor 2 family protein [Ardenticatenaceae bacterium]